MDKNGLKRPKNRLWGPQKMTKKSRFWTRKNNLPDFGPKSTSTYVVYGCIEKKSKKSVAVGYFGVNSKNQKSLKSPKRLKFFKIFFCLQPHLYGCKKSYCQSFDESCIIWQKTAFKIWQKMTPLTPQFQKRPPRAKWDPPGPNPIWSTNHLGVWVPPIYDLARFSIYPKLQTGNYSVTVRLNRNCPQCVN